MPNKFSNWVEFMIEQIFRNSYMKYFFARTVSKRAQFTPFSSINIPSKWELLIISAKFLTLYCTSLCKSSLVGPAYILFSLCCIQCHEVQNMCDIPPTVSEELLPWVQVTPYHPHNSVNLPRHLSHSTLHLLLGGDGSDHLYIRYTTMVTTVPLAWSHLSNEMSLIMSYPIVP